MVRVTAATQFFDDLGKTEQGRTLRTVSGRVRFDVVDGDGTDSWLVVVDNGQVTVERNAGQADCMIRGGRAVFDEVVAGRANPIAAVLRGALSCHGDLELLFAIQRIFPSPPRGWDPTATTRAAT